MKYEQPSPMTRDEIAAAIASGDPDTICTALVSAALHEADWPHVEELCLGQVRSDSVEVRRAALTCLGHIARIHGQLHMDKVLPILADLATDPDLSGTVSDVRDDIAMFLRRSE